MSMTRREFAISSGMFITAALIGRDAVAAQDPAPWYTKVRIWAHTNVSLKDVATYDVGFWRSYWKKTGTQAILGNAVAGFACFPSRNPLVDRSPFAPNRDLLGEIAEAAHADGVYVAARMDSGVLNPRLLDAYPDWRVVGPDGRAANAMCINSPYRRSHVFSIFQEVIERYRVDAFTDNGGLGGTALCHCKFCKERWEREIGGPLPLRVDFADPTYRKWKRWNTGVIMGAWEATQEFIRSAGGPDCLYMGYVRKNSALNREIAVRSPTLMMDMASRNDSGSYRELVDEARYERGMLGWQKQAIVASAAYHHSHGYYRLTADPASEARMYMTSGMAGGFNPWWIIPIASADRRILDVLPPVVSWRIRHDAYYSGTPIATAGVVRSDDHNTFFGRGGPGPGFGGGGGGSNAAHRGMASALFESRIPNYPINIKDFDRHAKDLSLMVIADIGCLSDAECASVRAYVRNGGALLATGLTSLYDQDGEQRTDFGLADVLGVNLLGPAPERTALERGATESYLRLQGQRRARHPALRAFDKTDVIAYGGVALRLKVASGRQVLANYAEVNAEGGLGPADPAKPAVIVGTFGKGRVAYMPVDIDRRFFQTAIGDQVTLLRGLLTWCAGPSLPLHLEGEGYVGAYLAHQNDGRRHVLHLINGSGVDAGNEISDRTFPVGPLKIRVRAPVGYQGRVRLLAANRIVPSRINGGMVEFELDRLQDYEVAVLE